MWGNSDKNEENSQGGDNNIKSTGKPKIDKNTINSASDDDDKKKASLNENYEINSKNKEIKANVDKKEDLIGDSKKSSFQKSKDSYGILKDSWDKSEDNNDNKNAEENENEKDN